MDSPYTAHKTNYAGHCECAGDEEVLRSYQLTVTLPDWQYVCIDLDLVAQRLDLYVNDRLLETDRSNVSIQWNQFPVNGLPLTSLHIYNEKVGPVNLFKEPFLNNTCGKNGTLISWPLMMAAMRPVGRGTEDLAAICGQDHSNLVFMSFNTDYTTAIENCRKLAPGGHFPNYQTLEV
jgi:hypothetical protein